MVWGLVVWELDWIGLGTGVWELDWNGLGTGGMGVKLEWPGDDAGYIQNHSWLT